jgi:hypothetical protein
MISKPAQAGIFLSAPEQIGRKQALREQACFLS